MKNITPVLLVLTGAMAMLFFLNYSTNTPVTDLNDYKVLPQVVQAPNINKQFDWSGEVVPFSGDARERLDRELLSNSYYHSSMIQYMKLANRYFPLIENTLRENSIPDDFKYLAVAESGLRNVSSPASAKGVWQFMKPSAKERGLEVNDEVDERYHVEKSTQAAASYLLYLKKRFGSWTNAAAAYNMGPTAFARQQKRQGQDNYYDLDLNSETTRYVFRLIAIKEIMNAPEAFGYYIDNAEKYPPFSNYYDVLVDKSITDWSVFAKENGTSLRELKRYNPWIRRDKLTVIKNQYKVRIPQN
jgi:membrane-bound lytic murein transglycosylase D